MLQALSNIASAFQAGVPLPRLQEGREDVLIDAASNLSEKVLTGLDEDSLDVRANATVLLYYLTSLTIAQFGASLVADAAFDIEREQERLTQENIDNALDKMLGES